MKRRQLYSGLGLAALALALALPAAFARGPGPRPDRDGQGDRRARIVEKLGLNEQQAAALEKLRDEHRDQARSLHEQVQAKREAMKALWLQPNPDRNQILAAEREIQALRGQLAESRIDFMFGMRRVLTPEQFKQFVEMKRGPGFGRHGGWHHGGMRDGPPADDE